MVKALLEYIVTSLVEKPDLVAIEQRQEEGRSILSIRVDPIDIGKIIGKNGRTIKAIRALVATVKSTHDAPISIEIAK